LEDVDITMKDLFNGVYKRKTVLVTGHTGFKGAWLSLWLDSLGANVVGYALPPPTNPCLFDAVGLGKRVKHIIGDVRDAINLERVIREYNPDIVFHLAAQPLVRLSYKEPRETYETNVMGTVNILEAVRHAENIRSCVIVTSDKCYENKENSSAYDEEDPLGGHDPYSSSKACAELVTASYRSSFFLGSKNYCKTAISTARAGNVIGGGDWADDRIVPDVIKAFTREEQITVRNPNAIRPWQHVLDSLAGYLWLSSLMYCDSQKYSSAWNFGPDETNNITVRELVEKIILRWGRGRWIDQSEKQKDAPHEAKILKLNCSKAKNLLEWQPVYNINDAVNESVDWYHKYYFGKKADMYTLTLKQLEAYAERAQSCGAAWAN
jgi:CDP-glucose 4,6-dehydratase